MDNPVVRLTWQMTPRNKFAAYMDRAMRLRGHAMDSLTDPATASVVWHTPTFATGSAKWTSTVSPRLLFEGGFSFNRERYDNVYQDGHRPPRGTPEWYAGARKNDNSTGLLWNASGAQLGNYPDQYNVMAAVSYVTGSHNVKVGLPGLRAVHTAMEHCQRRPLSDVSRRPAVAGHGAEHAAHDGRISRREPRPLRAGLVAPEKFTVNVGLRFDHVRQRIVGQQAQFGRFAASVPYDDIELPTWNDLSPRTSVVYDLFGNGKTAVRGSATTST